MASKSHSNSRSSSPHSSKALSGSSRRPNLMRASTTAPSLATSTASRKDLASLQYTRATALLTRVASYSVVQSDARVRTQRGDSVGSLGSTCSSPEEARSPSSRGSDGSRKESFDVAVRQSGNYFSFPSFEDFEEYREEQTRE